jgi:NAD(P)-dependent dehydrogenase (short-subunit alcohol dehydrogenase family)
MLWSLANSVLDASVLLSFDRTGYLRHRLAFHPGDLDVDLTGRTAIVTGANAGLGLVTARELARRGAEVRMVCRNRERGEDARASVARAAGHMRVRLDLVDVSELSQVRAFAARLDVPRIDVLVNNAGVLLDTFDRTAEGLERTLATNLVGPFLLTMLLAPRLLRSDDARVITVSSGGMYTQRLDVAALAPEATVPFDGVRAYARTKRAQVVVSELLAERYFGRPITWSAMHPGWADTPGVRRSLPWFRRVMQLVLRTPEEGADTIAWLAACPRLRGQSGRFWFDRQAVTTHLLSTRESAAEREALWEALVAWSGLTPAEVAASLEPADARIASPGPLSTEPVRRRLSVRPGTGASRPRARSRR